MKAALERAAQHAYTYLESLDRVAVAATVARTELLSRFDVLLTREGVSPSVIVDGVSPRSWGISTISSLSGCNALATSLRADQT